MTRYIFKDWNILKWLFNILVLMTTIYILGSLINVTFAIGYIIMLVVHEMGHMMAAYGYGVKVRFGGFTPFGAYIQILDQTSLKENAVIAISGPLCGLVTTIAYFFLYFLLKDATYLWLSFFTGIVSLMNLFPLDPFDGGKVIQGTCWFLPLAFVPMLGYGAVQSYQTFPIIATMFGFAMLYVIRDVWQMQKRQRIESLLYLEKPHRFSIFLVYLLIVILLSAMLVALFMDYGFALLPKVQPIVLPEFVESFFYRF